MLRVVFGAMAAVAMWPKARVRQHSGGANRLLILCQRELQRYWPPRTVSLSAAYWHRFRIDIEQWLSRR
jgi:hypothetical protein